MQPRFLEGLERARCSGATAGSAIVFGVVAFFSRRWALLKSSMFASKPLTIL